MKILLIICLFDFPFQYGVLSNRSTEIDRTVGQLKTISEQMVLCEPDSLKISDQIVSLENRQKRTRSAINDRIEMLGQHLEKMKNISKTIEESKTMISRVHSNLQELNRPVGSTEDDVKEVITAYEVSLIILIFFFCDTNKCKTYFQNVCVSFTFYCSIDIVKRTERMERKIGGFRF